MKNAIFTILFFIANFCVGQTFNLSGDLHWGTSGSDILGNVVQTLDGNKLIVGSSTGNDFDFQGTNFGGRDIWIIKLSTTNSIIWEKNYGGTGDDYGVDLVQMDSNSFMIIGYSNSPVSGNKTATNYGGDDVWVLKIDNNGNLLADYSYGSDQNDNLVDNSIVKINPNKYLIAAESGGGVSGNKTIPSFGLADSWLFAIDSNGNLLNQKALGGDQDEYSTHINYNSTNGSVFVTNISFSDVSGNKTANFYGGFYDVWIVKMDTNLNLLNQQSFGGSDVEYPTDLMFFNDKILITGASKSPVSGNKTCPKYGAFDAFLIALDTVSLNISSQYSYGGASSNSSFSNIDLIENEIILSGFANGPSNSFKTMNTYGQNDAWMISLDEQLNYKNNISFGGTLSDVTDQIVPFYSSGEFTVFYNSNSPGFTGTLSCANYGNYDIIQTQISSDLGIVESSNDFEIYPNPTDGSIHFTSNLDGKTCRLFDVNGNLIEMLKIEVNELNMSALSPGVYYLNIDENYSKIIKH